MNPEITEKFIIKLRKEKNLTQKDLAEILGVTDKAVSKWETGKCYPDIETLEKTAYFFGVTVNDLLSGKKNEAMLIEKTADSNLIGLMKRLEGVNKKWCRVFLCTIVSVFIVFGAVIFASCLPVEFDSGTCAGGFSSYIYDKYGEELAMEFLENYPGEPILVELSKGADVEWVDRIIFMEFDVTYQFADGEKREKTLRFVGERYWFEKYNWSRL